ncbi:MAG TPA: SCPU domain-containing protein [Xanthomonadaceae bacterium]|nr:SCPU domain-containing protein [Xanthomonadaceae bacterium]
MNALPAFSKAARCGPGVPAVRLLAALLSMAFALPLWAACSVSAQSVSFGDYVPFDTAPTDGVGSIVVTCDAVTPYTLSLDPGSGSQDARTLVHAGNVLAYNLYTDAGRSIVWGDGAGGTATVSGDALSQTYSVYGRIEARQNVLVGPYVDTITVILDY